MKDSHQVLILAIVLFLIGIVLIGWSQSIHIPSAYNTFLGIPYAFNPEFESSFREMLILFVMGFVFLGFSAGTLATIGYIRKLEKKIPETPPPP